MGAAVCLATNFSPIISVFPVEMLHQLAMGLISFKMEQLAAVRPIPITFLVFVGPVQQVLCFRMGSAFHPPPSAKILTRFLVPLEHVSVCPALP
jgi:hypothetical protein